MKNFSLLFILLLIATLFISCGGDYHEINEKDKVDTEWETVGSTEYIVNTASYTYHLSSCYITRSIKEENKVTTTDINFLIERQYTPCKKCINK